MCGYACVNCGRCRGEEPQFKMDQSEIPGYCVECGELNRPTAVACKKCGAPLANSAAPQVRNAANGAVAVARSA